MTKDALYVEWDSYAAQWLRNLISRGLIADGDVAECSITDVIPSDLSRYRQVHLFAGIGVWSYSLRRAGIPDTTNVWTFSEPCQPFSDAGKGLGFADERYLRPFVNHLIEQCRPAICLGEQVASNDGLGWLDIVQADMERAGYACGALDTCSAGVGAPQIRQRLRICATSEEWMAYPEEQRQSRLYGESRNRASVELERSSVACGMVHAERTGLEGLGRYVGDGNQSGRVDAITNGSVAAPGSVGRMANAASSGRGKERADAGRSLDGSRTQGVAERSLHGSTLGIGHNSGRPGPTNGHWSDADWLFCRDGFWRPVEPGTFPLANGAASRMGRLRAYGNAVDAEATTAFCRAAGEVLGLI